ncbi:SSI family serine proteinase inhibitor [Streptomyces sp. NPDC087440]|uniref:SSI family serine proteinase inhibitor n=1 Tax=Streptomyces sp. NPDC087440 TaxID=3365790 RepID=UPI003808914D
MNRFHRALAVAAACAALLPAAAPAAWAADPAPLGDLVLTKTYDFPSEKPPVSYTLTCSPDGGTHTNPAAACATLRKVEGDFRALHGRQQYPCDQTWQEPVTVTAKGTWNGTPVDWQYSHANSCFTERDTAGVFNF